MSNSRRDFIKKSTLGCFAGFIPLSFNIACNSHPKARPNILWLDVEDCSPDIGCYGTSIVHTPNIDQLAGDGIRYTNAIASCPVCSPSRSAMITGMYQTSIGAHQHRSHRDDGYSLPENVQVVTRYFKDHGYFTCRGEADNLDRQGKLDYNFQITFKEAFDGTDWSQRKEGQPFFAHVHFHETHRDFEADPDNPIDPDKVDIPPFYPDHPITRLDWALYLETVQILDKKVGKILDRLKDEGLEDNTVVFLTADHGRAMLWAKQWLYEGGILVPFLVRWPGHIEPGTVSDELVSLIDLAPTWMKIAGINPPEYMQGKDLFDSSLPERDYVFSARDRCDETDDRIRCVRSKKYKYIRNFYPDRPYTFFNAYKKNKYPVLTLLQVLKEQNKLTPEQEKFMAAYRPVEELYDLETDPYEVNNLAEKAGYQEILKEYRTRLDEWICQTKDKGQVPEDREVAHKWDKQMADLYKQWMTNKGLSPNVSNEKYLEWWKTELEKQKKAL